MNHHRVSCGFLGPHTTTIPLHTQPCWPWAGRTVGQRQDRTQGLWRESQTLQVKQGLPSPSPLVRPESHPSVHTRPSFLYREGRCSEQRRKTPGVFCISNTVKSGGVPSQAVSPELSGPESRGEHYVCCDTQDAGQWPHRPFL